MINKTAFEDIPIELAGALKETKFLVDSYLGGLSFLAMNTSREPSFGDTNLLRYVVQDFLESSFSIITLAMEGLHRVAKRELRFLVEASVKICYIQQSNYNLSIDRKLVEFDNILSSSKISIKNNINLSMLPENMRREFSEEVGKIYSKTSSYVHLTTLQVRERIIATQEGRTAGLENVADIMALNELIARGFACSLVLLFHSGSSSVAGEWLVEGDGSTINWYFTASRFIAAMDEFFDYKHERQDRLEEIQNRRREKISF